MIGLVYRNDQGIDATSELLHQNQYPSRDFEKLMVIIQIMERQNEIALIYILAELVQLKGLCKAHRRMCITGRLYANKIGIEHIQCVTETRQAAG